MVKYSCYQTLYWRWVQMCPPVYRFRSLLPPGVWVYILKIMSFPRFMGIIFSAKQCLKCNFHAIRVYKIQNFPGLRPWTPSEPSSSYSLSFFNSCKNFCPVYGSLFQPILWLPGQSPKPLRGTSVPTFNRELPPSPWMCLHFYNIRH